MTSEGARWRGVPVSGAPVPETVAAPAHHWTRDARPARQLVLGTAAGALGHFSPVAWLAGWFRPVSDAPVRNLAAAAG